jgi:hypothetical protein
MAYSYTPAFVAYCKGLAVEEIAREFNIPLDSLKSKIRQEGWKGLADRMCGLNGPVPADTVAALDRIEANREKNYETASKLRDQINALLDQYAAGTLRIRKYFIVKGAAAGYDAVPTPSDLLNLATCARTIADLTFRSLGDMAGQAGKKTANPETNPVSHPIKINLPPIISLPRQMRARLTPEQREELFRTGKLPDPKLIPPAAPAPDSGQDQISET